MNLCYQKYRKYKHFPILLEYYFHIILSIFKELANDLNQMFNNLLEE